MQRRSLDWTLQQILKIVFFSLKLDRFFLGWYLDHRGQGPYANFKQFMSVLRPYLKA